MVQIGTVILGVIGLLFVLGFGGFALISMVEGERRAMKLSSGLMLTNSSENTARDVLRITEYAALKRLRTEGKLSLSAVQSGKNLADEREIIWSWGYWYARALPRITDIVGEPLSMRLAKELDASVKAVGKVTLREMKKLD